jgi:hypothetical protein
MADLLSVKCAATSSGAFYLLSSGNYGGDEDHLSL